MCEEYDNQNLSQKYEALLNGIELDEYKDQILYDKCNLLNKQNLILENTILSLRHELSTLIAKQEFVVSRQVKQPSLANETRKSLISIDFEVSQFEEMRTKAVEAVKDTENGLRKVINTMKSKLFPPSKKILDFMSSVLDQILEIRNQLKLIHNYILQIENSATAKRENENKLNKFRSKSFYKLEQFGKVEKKRFVRYAGSPSESPTVSSNTAFEGLLSQVNSLMIALGISKNQRNQERVENEKLLIQLKQTKDQLAYCEESSAALELKYENKIKKLLQLIGSENLRNLRFN